MRNKINYIVIEMLDYNRFAHIPHAVAGSGKTLESLGQSDTFLFDLDDTIAIYDANFIVNSLFNTLKDHTYQVPDEQARTSAVNLHRHMNFGDKQKDILSEYFDGQEIRTFWDSFTARFHEELSHEHVAFDDKLVKFINFAIRNELMVGVISNSSQNAGSRVLEYLHDKNGINLTDNAVFLGSSTERKPSPLGLSRFTETTGMTIDPKQTTYIGNSMSDLLFAKNCDMTSVFVDYNMQLEQTSLTEMQKQLVSDSAIITNFSALKNFVERSRPHYKRQISLSIEPSLSKGSTIDLTNMPLCLEPTEDNLYRIAVYGSQSVMNHVPSILRRFHDAFESTLKFSVVNIPNYITLFHESTGAVKLPAIEDLPDPYRRYFSANRIRAEGKHLFARGANYYKQYIVELADNPEAQISIARQEVLDALVLLKTEQMKSGTNELLKLAVHDNLRGNIQSFYLSIINALREEDTPEELAQLKTLHTVFGEHYESALELEYGHMLGLDYDERKLLVTMDSIEKAIDQYRTFSRLHGRPFKFKSPEVDHPILIATRANELCEQYPDTNLLIGLSSGGVELASVTRLLRRHKLKRDTDVIHYPISVHHGLTMWAKDKDPSSNQPLVDTFFSIESAKGKRVVICEDNSNSGQTLDRVISRLCDVGAAETHFAVIEIDPTRLMMHAVQQKAGAKHDIGLAATRMRPVVNYFHPDFIGAVSVVKILLSDQGFTKVIAIDTANKYSQE